MRKCRSVAVLNIAAALIVASLIITPIPTNVRAAGAVLLRFHWSVGQQFSESSVDSQTSAVTFPKLPAADSASTEVDRYTSVATVSKVFPDGSGLVHLTYRNVSITTGGKTTTYPLKGYALDLRISTLGKVLSKVTTGTASSALSSDITDPTPLVYPVAAIPIGGSWSDSEVISGLDTVTEHLQLQAIGSVQGRQTATILLTANVPLKTTISGLAVSGAIVASGKQVVFVDTETAAEAGRLAMSMKASLKGSIDGTSVTGTMALSEVQVSTP